MGSRNYRTAPLKRFCMFQFYIPTLQISQIYWWESFSPRRLAVLNVCWNEPCQGWPQGNIQYPRNYLSWPERVLKEICILSANNSVQNQENLGAQPDIVFSWQKYKMQFHLQNLWMIIAFPLYPEVEKVKSVSGNLRIGPKTFCKNDMKKLLFVCKWI